MLEQIRLAQETSNRGIIIIIFLWKYSEIYIFLWKYSELFEYLIILWHPTIVFELSFDSFVKQRDIGSLDLKLNLMLIYATNGHRQFFTMSSSNSLSRCS